MQKQPTDDRYWVVDFDRCLGNVDALFDHYIAVLRDHHAVDPQEIIAARKKTEASKGSFDLIGYLLSSGTLATDELEQAGQEFIRRSAGDLAVLMPGTQKFLRYLTIHYGGRYGIMTYGNPYWQRLKIAAAGLSHLPCMVVDSSHKARQIASWYDEPTSRYVLPEVLSGGLSADELTTVREIILVDDKRVAFDGLDATTRGYLVSPQAQHEIELTYHGRVDRVPNLGVIIERERYR